MDSPVIGITGYADQSARPPNIAIFALARTYIRAVTMDGGTPVIIPPYLEGPSLRGAFDGIDGLILSGGGDIHPSAFGEADSGLLWRIDRKRDHAELSLARWALGEGLPVLAICRGIQTLNVAAGGTLIQDIPTQIPNALTHSCIAGRPVPDIAHTVSVDPRSRLAELIGAGDVGVNSAHHQAVKAVGNELVAVARTADGVIEGLESPAHPFCIGVQWHPEAMVESSPVMRHLFRGLIQAAQT
ncbi:MAG: gamma-glutamyl-gamma-aminobutyrate hydrolase family protein [Anaerolineae bacterium]|jgi:putative glutamine amidotransferase